MERHFLDNTGGRRAAAFAAFADTKQHIRSCAVVFTAFIESDKARENQKNFRFSFAHHAGSVCPAGRGHIGEPAFDKTRHRADIAYYIFEHSDGDGGFCLRQPENHAKREEQ